MNIILSFLIMIGLCLLGLNSICGLIAYSLAKKRSITPLYAFFAALLGSVWVVFFISMFPVKKEFRKFPKLDF